VSDSENSYPQSVSAYGYSPERRHLIVRMRDIKLRLGLSESHLYQLILTGKFPKPFPLVPGGAARGWFEGQIQDYLQQRLDECNDATTVNAAPPHGLVTRKSAFAPTIK